MFVFVFFVDVLIFGFGCVNDWCDGFRVVVLGFCDVFYAEWKVLIWLVIKSARASLKLNFRGGFKFELILWDKVC